MCVVQTLYNNLVGGSSIMIYYPNQEQATVIKANKNEDFRITVLRSLNEVGKQGWSMVNSHHREFQVSGSSGTSSEETVYLFKRVLDQ